METLLPLRFTFSFVSMLLYQCFMKQTNTKQEKKNERLWLWL